jgi:hypothetical protein
MSLTRSSMSSQPARSSAKEVVSMPYSSGGRPATAFSATLEISWPSYVQAFVPSTRVMNLGARSAYLAGSRPSNTFGGSTTWSSTLASTMSLMSIADSVPSDAPRVSASTNSSVNSQGAATACPLAPATP